MRIRSFFVAGLILATLAGAGHAGVDFDATENGMADTSGARGQSNSYGLTGLVLNTNNRFIAPPVPHDSTEPIDAARGVNARDKAIPIGYLLPGPNDTRLTYDRLVAQPVLQLLGYDKTRPRGEEKNVPNIPESRSLTFADRGLSPSHSGPRHPDKPPVIPEPSSLAILLAGGAVLLRRPRRDELEFAV